MKIAKRPDEELVVQIAAASMATGAGAGGGSHDFAGRLRTAQADGNGRAYRGHKGGGWEIKSCAQGFNFVNRIFK